MNKTKIEWCDGTWNPVTGCMNSCEYCYARRIANRFAGSGNISQDGLHVLRNPMCCAVKPDHEGNENTRRDNYPFGFEPTYHRYRLKELLELKKPQNIFVCSMADLFGDWVPDQWIQEILAVCNMAKRHNYLFLTKNPGRYIRSTQYPMDYRGNMWFGTTINNNHDMEDRGMDLYYFKMKSRCKIFLSIEPIQEGIRPNRIDNVRYVDWVIIGAETGNRKEKMIPKKEWIDSIVDACNRYGVPVLMKDSLIDIVGEEHMIREFPEKLRR
jgi:protein gp37